MSDLIERAESYLAHNAAESGADVLIRELIDEIKRLQDHFFKVQRERDAIELELCTRMAALTQD